MFIPASYPVIHCRYRGATNYSGSVINVSIKGGSSLQIPYPNEYGPGMAAYHYAATLFLAKIGKPNHVLVGGCEDGGHYIFVATPPTEEPAYMPAPEDCANCKPTTLCADHEDERSEEATRVAHYRRNDP